MNCCVLEGTAKFFNKQARRTEKSFRKKGLRPEQKYLVEGIRQAGMGQAEILEIGCGIGALHLSLLKDGAAKATGIDISEQMIAGARRLAEEMGMQQRAQYSLGDFIEMEQTTPAADVTILDKVICCYENARDLIAHSLAKTRRIYAVCYPRRSALVRVVFRLGIAAAKLLRLRFHPYYHEPEQIEKWITTEGLEKTYEQQTLIWVVQVFNRRGEGMKHSRLVFFPAMLMGLVLACGGPVVVNRQSKPEISADDVRHHVNYLASDALEGRLSGTAGGAAAAKYIAAEFKRFGLTPIGDNGSYFQEFDFIGGVRLGRNNRMVVEGATDTLAVGRDLIPVGFSDSREVSGLLAFVGYGISAPQQGYDDYANLDVKDRIVIALRYSPESKNPHSQFRPMEALRYKTLQAREHGAKALLIVTGLEDDPEDVLPKLRYERGSGDAGLVVAHITRRVADTLLAPSGQTIATLQHKINAAHSAMPGSGAGAAERASMLIDGRVTLIVDIVREKRKAANVVALLEGNDPVLKEEYVLIGAHYDHLGRGSEGAMDPEKENEIRNGADDNASGSAGILELAQHFAAQEQQPKRSLIFASFAGEELGLLGSARYVAAPAKPLTSTVAMINLDMIGRLRDSTLVVEGIGTSPAWSEMVERINQRYGFALRAKKDGFGPSDHASFYGKNVPVLFFFTNLHDDYHRATDDVDKINAVGEAAVVRMVADVSLEIANAAVAPQFTKASPDSQPQARGFRVSVGTIPDYAAEAEGMPISGVRPGSPAEKAGLQAGDVIIKFGNYDIKNVYDYTYALGSFSPGDEVELVAIRGGEKVTVKVKLEGRR